MSKLQLAKWGGNGTIRTHRNTMVDLRSQLLSAGVRLDDENFYEYFTNSLPRSLDFFISLYDDDDYGVDRLCSKFAKYEMRRMLRHCAWQGCWDIRRFSRRVRPSINIQGEGEEGDGEDYRHVTCFGCGKKGISSRSAPTSPRRRERNLVRRMAISQNRQREPPGNDAWGTGQLWRQ